MTKQIKITISIIILIGALGSVFFQSLQEYDLDVRDSKSLAQNINHLIFNLKGEIERSDGEVELIIRKCAHLLEYTFYGTVVFLVVFINIRKKWLAYFIVFFMTIPIPFIDELFFQARTIGRSVSILDIGIDFLGITLAIILGSIYWLVQGLSRPNFEKSSNSRHI